MISQLPASRTCHILALAQLIFPDLVVPLDTILTVHWFQLTWKIPSNDDLFFDIPTQLLVIRNGTVLLLQHDHQGPQLVKLSQTGVNKYHV